MSETTVNVTAADIKRGIRKHPSRCPVARALRRATRKSYIVAHIRATYHDGSTIWFPASVTRFIQAFDEGRKVAPFRWSFLGGEGVGGE